MKTFKTGRVCCICGKRRNSYGGTPGFKTALARAGFTDRGFGFDKAHIDCVRKFLDETAAKVSDAAREHETAKRDQEKR